MNATTAPADELADRFGFTGLTAPQRQALDAAVAGRDVVGVMPTGSGKSAIYQMAGELIPGGTLVVSPLIALQHDQLDAIHRLPVGRAAALNSAGASRDGAEALAAWSRGSLEFLLAAPEQLSVASTAAALQARPPSLVVIDEAHCVDTWGRDFRPSYGRLGEFIRRAGRPTVLALTATASPPVRKEIIARLGLRDPLIVVSGFDRPNVDLTVRRCPQPQDKREALFDAVRAESCGLVYVARRAATVELASELRDREVRALAYHGGMPAAERRGVHEAFRGGGSVVVVATSAFGMGIDRSDVRFVVHHDIPGSLDDYAQEIGRAGRDGEPARAVLLHRAEDLGLRRYFAGRPPTAETVTAVVGALAGRRDTRRAVETRTNLSARSVDRVVNELVRHDLVDIDADGLLDGRRMRTDDAVSALDAAGRRYAAVERSRVEMMRAYADASGCRRAFLLGYFGETFEPPCGRCDNCRAGIAEEAARGPFRVGQNVRHREWGEGSVMQVATDRLTVYFETAGYRTLDLDLVLGDGLLV